LDKSARSTSRTFECTRASGLTNELLHPANLDKPVQFRSSCKQAGHHSEGLPPRVPPGVLRFGDSTDGRVSRRRLRRGRKAEEEEESEGLKGEKEPRGARGAGLALVSSPLPLKRCRVGVKERRCGCGRGQFGNIVAWVPTPHTLFPPPWVASVAMGM